MMTMTMQKKPRFVITLLTMMTVLLMMIVATTTTTVEAKQRIPLYLVGAESDRPKTAIGGAASQALLVGSQNFDLDAVATREKRQKRYEIQRQHRLEEEAKKKRQRREQKANDDQ
mmetsp:Transcript_1012/g.2403  ORF Transcript_1012/g.2403 Transcript_1012/m.2403 type:complete len:115 (+) Transcript_1012:155-499(+)